MESITLEAELERLRSEISTVREKIAWLDGSPLTLAEAKHQASESVRHIAKNSRLPGKVGYFAHSGYVGAGLADGDDPVSLLCALAPEVVERGLHLLLETQYEFIEPGPASKDRPKIRRELEEQLFSLEIREEKLICRWEVEHGAVHPRRPDCNPAIALAADLEVA